MNANPAPAPEKTEKTEGDLFAVMTWATAFSMAVMTGFLASIQDLKAFTLVFGLRTLIGFLAGGAAGWAVWKVVRSKMAR